MNKQNQEIRFYPSSVPSYIHEPTRDNFSIVSCGGNYGDGVVANRPYRKGELLFVFTGFFMSKITQYSLQLKEDTHIHDPYFMGKILHSCDPNALCRIEERSFYALRDIEAGECITMDYDSTEDHLFKAFQCQCNSKNCRGLIKGRLF